MFLDNTYEDKDDETGLLDFNPGGFAINRKP